MIFPGLGRRGAFLGVGQSQPQVSGHSSACLAHSGLLCVVLFVVLFVVCACACISVFVCLCVYGFCACASVRYDQAHHSTVCFVLCVVCVVCVLVSVGLAVWQVHPTLAGEHQLIIIDCLEDPDDTLRRKTLDLLFRITNAHNVTIIVDKLAAHLRQTTDPFLRTELVARITQIAEQLPSFCASLSSLFLPSLPSLSAISLHHLSPPPSLCSLLLLFPPQPQPQPQPLLTLVSSDVTSPHPCLLTFISLTCVCGGWWSWWWVGGLHSRFSPSTAWYLQTMNGVLELGGSLVRENVAHHMLRLLAESSQESQDLDPQNVLLSVLSCLEKEKPASREAKK